MTIHTEGEKSNPVDGTLLADTGQVLGGTLYVAVLVTGTLLTTVRIQQRNAANNGNIAQFLVKSPANDTKWIEIGAIPAQDNERIRIVTEGAHIGTVQALVSVN